MRPTAIIREMLVLSSMKVAATDESIKEKLAQDLIRIRNEMRESGVEIVDREINQLDVSVHYRHDSKLQEAQYMRAMLDAEARDRVTLLLEEPNTA